MPEPEEIIIPESTGKTTTTENQKPVLIAPAPHTRMRGLKSYRDKTKISKVATGKKPSINISDSGKNTILKTSSSKTQHINKNEISEILRKNRASRSAPDRIKRKQATPRQNNIFKRFTVLVIDFFKEKFVWAKKKVDAVDIEHDKRIAENYMFDEVLGRYISRAAYEKKVKFNQDDYKPTPEEISRFPSRLKNEKPEVDHIMSFDPSMSHSNTALRMRPPRQRG